MNKKKTIELPTIMENDEILQQYRRFAFRTFYVIFTYSGNVVVAVIRLRVEKLVD